MNLKRLTSLFVLVFAIMSIFAATTISSSAASITVAQVTSLKATDVEISSATLSWSTVSGATGYQIYGAQTSVTSSYTRYDSTTSTSYDFGELVAGETYKFKVRAYYRATDGTVTYGSFSSVVQVTTDLSQVQNLTIDIVDGTTVNLSWDAVSDATGYQIYYKEASASSYTRLTSTTNSSIELAFDETTYVEVRAYYRIATGNVIYGPFSDIDVIVDMVKGFDVDVDATTATFTWNAIDDVDGYKISYLNDLGNWITLTYTSKTTATVTLSSLQTYTVSIRAYEKSTGSTVHSDYSDSITFTMEPAQVTSLNATDVEYTAATLTWDEVGGASGYQIYGKQTGVTSSYTRYDSTTETSYSFDSLEGEDTYQFKVRAFYRAEDGTVTYGAFSSVISFDTTLSQVQNVTITSTSDSSALISWDAVVGAGAYQVYIQEKGATKYSYYQSPTDTSIELNLDTVSQIKIRAIYRIDSSTVSYAEYSDVVTYVGTVSGFEASVDSASVDFSWDEVDGADGYKISYLTASGSWSTLTYTANTSISVSLDTYTQYTVSIRAYEKTVASSTIHSEYSDSLTFTTAPAKIENLAATDIQLESATISWDEVDGAQKYQIYVSEVADDGSTTYVWLTSVTETSFTFEVLEANTTYSVKMRAFYQDGSTNVFGSFIALQFTTGLAQTKDLTLTAVDDSNENATKIISWSEVAGATGYQIWVKTETSSTYTLYATTTKTSVEVDFKAYQNTSPSIKVRAYYTLNGTTTYGSFSTAVTTAMGTNTVKNFTTGDVTNYTMQVTWSQSGNCTGYIIKYRVAGTDTWSVSKTITSSTTTSYSFDNLTMGTEYEFSIKAYFGTTSLSSAETFLTATTTAVTTDVVADEKEVTIFENQTYQVTASLTPELDGPTITLVPQDYEYTYGGSWLLGFGEETVTFKWNEYFSYDDNGVITPKKATVIQAYYDDDGDLDNEDDVGTYFAFEVLVKATDSDAYDTIYITIKELPIEITTAVETWYVGMTSKLTANVYDEDYYTDKLVWTSSNESIATVDDSGNVAVVGTGYVEITVATSDNTHTYTYGIRVES